MSAAKKLFTGCRAALVSLFRPLEGNVWFLAVALCGCAMLGVTTFHLWKRYGDLILSHPQYRLNPDHLVVTPQPAWIRSDVTTSAVTYGHLRDANLLDRELVLQVKQAFGVQPWVRRVRRVNKQYPSSVEVDLEYRRPLAMVEVPAGMFPGFDYEGLLPVDTDGVLLPVEMDEQQASAYPKIAGIDTSPAGPPGSPWGDTRVTQAAQIVILLEEIWKPLQLQRIVVPERHSASDAAAEAPLYVLATCQGRQFAWGSAPGQEQPGEEKAADKVAGLKRFLQEHGPLDSLEGDNQAGLSRQLDLRVGRARPPIELTPR